MIETKESPVETEMTSASSNLDDKAAPKKKPHIIIVMPAYNAAMTLEKTYYALPAGSYDQIILVDDASSDNTLEVASKLDITGIRHRKNRGYGGNQKTCYSKALEQGADIVVMLHPDYQYDPTIAKDIVQPILRGEADVGVGQDVGTRCGHVGENVECCTAQLPGLQCSEQGIFVDTSATRGVHEHGSGFD